MIHCFPRLFSTKEAEKLDDRGAGFSRFPLLVTGEGESRQPVNLSI